MSNLPVEPPLAELTLAGLPADLFWEKYKASIIGGTAIFIVLVVAVAGWLIYSHNEKVNSETMFANAQTAEAYRAVADKYPGTPVAGNALLLLAAAKRPDLAQSNTTYEEVMASSPNYPLVSSASLGLAGNAELANTTPKAIELLQQTAAAYQNSYAAPYALYASGELLLREGKRGEALKAFRDLVGSYPEAPSARIAQMQIERLAIVSE